MAVSVAFANEHENWFQLTEIKLELNNMKIRNDTLSTN